MPLIEVQTDAGPILVELAHGTGLKGVTTGEPTAVVGKAENSLEDVLASVSRVGEAAIKKLSALQIETAEVEVGVKFGGKGKFFFAEVAGEAALTVRLTFKGAR